MKSSPLSIQKNEVFQATITDQNNLGNGVCRYKGAVVFVPAGVVGDEAELKIIKVASSYAVARIERLITPSCHRITPNCTAFPRCGGCVYANLTYEKESELKRDYVQNALRKAGLSDLTVAPLLTTGVTEGYRNKVQYPVTPDFDIGYYARHSHEIIPCATCPLQEKEMTPILGEIVAWGKEYRVRGVRHLYLRHGKDSHQMMVCLVTERDALAHTKELVARLTARFPEIVSIQQNIQPDDTNVILGEECRVLYGQAQMEDVLCGLRFRLSPLSFYQVNHDAAQLLYEKVFALAKVQSGDLVADLFCGAGTIGLCLIARHPEASLVGVEIVPEAVENAKENARANGIENARFYCGDAEDPHIAGADVIIVDPPRKGCSPSLIAQICHIAPRTVVYVSCNPDTLARDLVLFREGGYEIGEVTPVDLFARTGHVESVVCLTRKI